MKNEALVKDYLDRASARLKAVALLQREESWADVVRESQEVIELSLKALLRASGIEVPRIHDVSPVLEENVERLPRQIRPHLEKICGISRSLRRDRELAFYGSEDLTPGQFYRREDGQEALNSAKWVVGIVRKACRQKDL
ncbi:MAG: HEPN domain-containing protein [Deltaproteobacteria bacterium]|nr:HEPN domain-containing protein [Deltaproteobacteria bacterium]